MLTMTAPVRAQSTGSDMGQDQAQSQAAPAQAEDKHMQEFAGLNLTDEQKAQIKQIRTDSRSQMDAVNADSALAADAKQAKIREIRKGTHQQMLKVLTPEQRKQMKQNMRERRSEHQQQAQPQAQSPAAPQQ
jgi:Spy/CpxP family protein refolding chaperone